MSLHTPVLLDESLEALQLAPQACYLDATFGRGGHSKALQERCPQAELWVCDRDHTAIDSLHHWDRQPEKAWNMNYSEIDQHCPSESLDGILADLGLCSAQLDQAGRGFSFNSPGPLDMRMDLNQDLTLEQLLATTSETDLANIIYRYGEERRSRAIARHISAAFKAGNLKTTADLAHIVRRCIKPSRHEQKHPATRTFQALRIAVNNEFEHLELFLDRAPYCLKDGGRLVLITFHSLEYRIVKEHFQDQLKNILCAQKGFVMKKMIHPLFPTAVEQEENPRARSARLHVYERQPL